MWKEHRLDLGAITLQPGRSRVITLEQPAELPKALNWILLTDGTTGKVSSCDGPAAT